MKGEVPERCRRILDEKCRYEEDTLYLYLKLIFETFKILLEMVNHKMPVNMYLKIIK